MTLRNLDLMLAPRSVALIGASERPGSIGQVVLKNLRAGGFAGEILLVNPKYTSCAGLPCHASVERLPRAPDLAVIATPAPTVPGLVAELAARGTRAVVVLSAGFGGDEGRRLRQQMLEAAQPNTLRVLGPNCVGLIAPGIGLNASFAHGMPASGRLALVSQSGAIVASVIDFARGRNIGFSQLLSLGDVADVDFGDALDYLAGDPATSAILLYVEAVTHARKFMSAARRTARIKPVIVIKAGRHAGAARAVASHTGALAGSDAVYEAAFERAGLLRVFDLDALFEAAETLATARRPTGERLLILTNGGGIGILAADALLDHGLPLVDPSEATLARLDAVLPPTWSRGNPVDVIGDAPAERFARALEILLEDEGSDATLALNCPTAVTSAIAAAHATIEVAKRHERTLLTSWVGDETALPARRLLDEAGIPTYDTPEHAVRAFAHIVRFQKSRERLMETPPSLPDSFTTDPAAVRRILDAALAEGRSQLAPPEARALLRAYGIATNREAVARTPEEARLRAAELGGPVALKILSPDISHKSDVGGVVLRLDTPEKVESAARAMAARVREARPQARLDGFTLEPMVERPLAYELILGVSEDPQFGPVILFGRGGVAVEVIGDRALALPPLNLKLARELISRTRVYRQLQGFRDRPPAALDEIALALLKVAQLAVDFGEIVELDVNPLLADADGVLALDARVAIRRYDGPAAARLAIRPYPSELEETVSQPDGTGLLLRPIRPEDEPQLEALVASLSPESVRLRFFTAMRQLGHALAARLAQLDYDREMALVLTTPGSAGRQPILGVARLFADPDNERAEFAIVLRDELAGRGLGTLLMKHLIEYARRRGTGVLYGDVLRRNARMLELCRRLGFATEAIPGEPDTVRVLQRLR